MAVIVKMNDAGAKALLKSAEVEALMMSHAKKVAARADVETSVEAKQGKKRSWARVGTTGAKAAAKNAKHNTLLKALGG